MDLACSGAGEQSEWLEHSQGGERGRDDIKEDVTFKAKVTCDPAVLSPVETLEKNLAPARRRHAHVCPMRPCPRSSITTQVFVKEKGWVCVIYSEDGVLISSRKE